MNIKIQYLLYTLISLSLGVLLAFFLYLNMFFIILFILYAIIFLVTFIIDKINKTSEWKKFITPIAFLLLTLLVSYISARLIEYDILNRRNQLIENIYTYKTVHNKFPADLNVFGAISKKYHYSVDSSLSSFEITFRGMYGFPNSFKSKDSVWTLP